MVHRRGRCFGWIGETLEGSLHLLITGALDARSPEADWILKDYEDNRYLSNQYGYLPDDFDQQWFGRGGMSLQACLLLDVEPYRYRDDVKQALRALFNAEAAQFFPAERMNTEHALPALGDWTGDHYKSSDQSNVAGWLQKIPGIGECPEQSEGCCDLTNPRAGIGCHGSAGAAGVLGPWRKGGGREGDRRLGAS